MLHDAEACDLVTCSFDHSMCLPKQGAEMSELLEAQRGASGVLLHHFGPGLFTSDCVWHLNSPFALHAGLQTMSSLA